jgi:hypothetical protein
MRDGILRRVSDCTWEGTLDGYTVLVTFYYQEGWWYYVGHGERGYCLRMAPARSFRDAARRARAFIEAAGPARPR